MLKKNLKGVGNEPAAIGAEGPTSAKAPRLDYLVCRVGEAMGSGCTGPNSHSEGFQPYSETDGRDAITLLFFRVTRFVAGRFCAWVASWWTLDLSILMMGGGFYIKRCSVHHASSACHVTSLGLRDPNWRLHIGDPGKQGPDALEDHFQCPMPGEHLLHMGHCNDGRARTRTLICPSKHGSDRWGRGPCDLVEEISSLWAKLRDIVDATEPKDCHNGSND